ncbi:hypothetical protein [Xanthomonas translucens]|uniref:hypothetical protein n=1 Tax=Xanthomonas campestris pv. translucens TaxID=343 RepID=UPI00071E863B|nr:hypothetical protein [Xanthomonas translucens]WLA02753.1 hypothetical protein MO330_09710 [Xanthomonas translucens]
MSTNITPEAPSYDAILLIAQSVTGALSRAGFTDCDDPGEAIDVLRERYERRIAELLAAQPAESHASFALRALVAAGHVQTAKVDEALAIAANVLPASSAGEQEPVAVVGADFSLHWAGSGPIAPLVERHGIKVGDALYPAPVAGEAAQLDSYAQGVRDARNGLHGPFIRSVEGQEAAISAGPDCQYRHLSARGADGETAWLPWQQFGPRMEIRHPAALPAPVALSWRDVLDPADPEGSYKRLRSQHHPDNGGSAEAFQRVQRAWDAYQQEEAR